MPNNNYAKTRLDYLTPPDQYFGYFVDPLNNDSQQLNIDGSVTPVEFKLQGLPDDATLIIQRINFLISSSTEVIQLEQFGNIPALPNGLIYKAQGPGAAGVVIKSNGEFILVSTEIFVENYIKSTSSQGGGIYGSVDFKKAFGGNGSRVKAGDVSITIRDNLTGIDFFQMSCYGILLSV